MKYFTFNEILISLLTFFVFGAFEGFFYRVWWGIIRYSSYVIGLPRFLFLPYKTALKELKSVAPSGDIPKIGTQGREAGDFCFSLLFGVKYILLSYVLLDGIFRLYTVVAFLLSFLFAFWALACPQRWFDKMIMQCVRCFIIILNVFFAPARIAALAIEKTVKCLRVLFRILVRRTKRLTKLKTLYKK